MGLRMGGGAAPAGGGGAPGQGGEGGSGGDHGGAGDGGSGGGFTGGGGRQVQRSGGGHFAPGRGQDGGSQGDGRQREQRGGRGAPGAGGPPAEYQRQIQTLTQEIQQLRQRSQGDGEVLSRIRQAFAPEGEGGAGKGGDPRKAIEQQLDYYLSQAVEAEKDGTPIPLTTNLAAHYFQSQLQHMDEKQALEARIADLENGLKTQQNPNVVINRAAFGQMDNVVRRGLDSLYGRGAEHNGKKAPLFDSIAASIQKEVEGLATRDFQQWDEIRRDPGALQEMAERHLAQLIPPQARAMLEQQRLVDTPMKVGELREALREAQKVKDPQKRSELCTSIRRDLWEAMFSSGKLRLRE